MKILFRNLALALGLAGVVGTANAVVTTTLKFVSGATTVTVTDNGVGPTDNNPLVGGIAWSGTVGNYSVSVSSGVTAPIVGSATQPQMDLAWQVTRSGGGTDTLEISFTHTDFGPTTNSFSASTNGTVNAGGVTYTTWYGPNSNSFELGTQLTNSGTLLGGPYSDTRISGGISDTLYSLTQVVLISNVNGFTQGDAHLTAVPDSGASVLLLGVGLTGLGLLSRMRRKIA